MGKTGILPVCFLAAAHCLAAGRETAPPSQQPAEEKIGLDGTSRAQHRVPAVRTPTPLKREEQSGGPLDPIRNGSSWARYHSAYEPRIGDYTVHLDSGRDVRCRLRDRLDARAWVAYEFNHGAMRLDIPVRSHLAGHGIMIRFSYNFGSGRTHAQECRADSPYQGIVGSLYHELYEGRHDVDVDLFGRPVKP